MVPIDMASLSTPRPSLKNGGYPKLASTMARVPEFTIFRRFTVLNRLNLLRLQAQLQVLEEELREIQKEDDASVEDDRKDLTIDFQALRDSEGTPNYHQLEKISEIAKVLQDYNGALLQASALDRLPAPHTVQFQEYRKWLTHRSECGVNFPRPWEDAYQDNHAADQLVFHDTNPEHDPIFSFLEGPIVNLIHRFRGRPKVMPKDGIMQYSDNTIARTSNAISAALSSLLPTVCVLVLYFVKSMIIRLCLMILFTAIFSIALAFFTSGKKHEIFGATAAFAAVEVVFIGSTSVAN